MVVFDNISFYYNLSLIRGYVDFAKLVKRKWTSDILMSIFAPYVHFLLIGLAKSTSAIISKNDQENIVYHNHTQ